jgi:glucokinase
MATRTENRNGTGTAKEEVRLVADVGGTNVRFAVVGASPQDLQGIETLRCADYPAIGDAVQDYLGRHGIGCLSEICMAVAGPVSQDLVSLPNSHWSFSLTDMKETLGAPLKVINDFTAQAWALDALRPEELMWFGEPRPAAPGVRTVLGPGTGLGIAVLTAGGEVIPSEGGHVGFAPSDQHGVDLFRSLLPRFRRVSAERVISGPGLENIYWANRQLHGPDPLSEHGECPADRIAGLASEGDAIATRTVRDFFDLLASFAGDMALFAWSTGGVYLSGGVMKRLSEFLDVARFRERFEDKGRFAGFCRTVPLAWITHEYPGLLGCAAVLARESPAQGVAGAAAPW